MRRLVTRDVGGQRGIGLIIAIALLTMVALGIALTAPVVFEVTASENADRTTEDLDRLKTAISGNPRLLIGTSRADFGFIGTMGSVPSQLAQLWLKGSQTEYSFDTTKKIGAGWVGPYVPSTFAEDLLSFDKDRFGNALTYTSTVFTRTTDGQSVATRIQSAGQDGLSGTADDLLVDILAAEVYSTVTGKVLKGTQPVGSATVTLNLPVNGTTGQQFATTDAGGTFTFSNVTFGFRSVSIDPRLTYEPNSAGTQGGNNVRFTVTNYATNAVTITSLSATYNKTAWYEGIRVGNTDVFSWTTTRAASGQPVMFNPVVTIDGSGKPSQVVPIRVDKEITITPDLLIKGVGKSVVIQLQNFKDKVNDIGGNAGNVNMSNTAFTINFSDGSQNTFNVP
jgi:hypothetical protein